MLNCKYEKSLFRIPVCRFHKADNIARKQSMHEMGLYSTLFITCIRTYQTVCIYVQAHNICLNVKTKTNA